MKKLVDIKGFGRPHAKRLTKIGIETLDALLITGASKDGRAELATTCRMDEKLLLKWVNRADLSRIRGISALYTLLLENVGVDSMSQLAQHEAIKLQPRLAEINRGEKLVRIVPGINSVSSWIKQAKKLPELVTN